ncbi:hypothetical protein KBY88_03880 [Cyanobium sp. Morenito 9A2]|nr:hypothetical protein [Cyanobium sp. Morenito 9A2]
MLSDCQIRLLEIVDKVRWSEPTNVCAFQLLRRALGMGDHVVNLGLECEFGAG